MGSLGVGEPGKPHVGVAREGGRERGDGGHCSCHSALGHPGQVTVSQLEMLSVTRAE